METSTPVLPDIDSGIWDPNAATNTTPNSANEHAARVRRERANRAKQLHALGIRKPKRGVGLNASLPNALYGDADPQQTFSCEKPVHRTMARMAMEGFTCKEIAQFTGYGENHVSRVLRQPFIRQHMVENIQRTFEDELKELLQSEVIPSVQTLTEIRDDKEAPKAVRAATSEYLIDRWLGKPTQPIENKAATEPAKLTTQELESRVNSIIAGVPTPPGDPDRH